MFSSFAAYTQNFFFTILCQQVWGGCPACLPRLGTPLRWTMSLCNNAMKSRRRRDGLCNNELTRVDTRRCFSSDVARVVRTDDRVEPPTDFIPPHSQFFFILLSTTSVKRPRRIAGHVDSTRTKRFRLHVPRFERIDVTYVCKYIVHSLYILIFIVF